MGDILLSFVGYQRQKVGNIRNHYYLSVGWAADSKWSSKEELIRHHGHVPIKVFDVPPATGMGRPYEIRLPLEVYFDYATTNTADSPFYGFEYDFSDARQQLLADFQVFLSSSSFFTLPRSLNFSEMTFIIQMMSHAHFIRITDT